ncbi:amidohydrolase family protein [Pirellulaceae bacterium SH501]
MPSVALRPAWIFSITSPPIANAWLVATDGVIEFIGRELPDRFRSILQRELPNTALLPGLINAHCHLEFSDMAAPIEFTGSFISWIQSVVRHRAAVNSADVAMSRRLAIEQGIRESYLHGTRVLLDTITAPWSPSWVPPPGTLSKEAGENESTLVTDALIGRAEWYLLPIPEVLDINPLRGEATTKFSGEVYKQIDALSMGDQKGFESSCLLPLPAVSPHSPYTASLELFRECSDWTRGCGGLVAPHLAESLEETAWLFERADPIESALAPFRDPAFGSRRASLEEYLDTILDAPKGILAHANYLDDVLLSKISGRSPFVAIAHCPRTFRHFHPDRTLQNYPMAERLANQVPHVLGTDSRASNPDLSLWREMQALLHYPGVTGEQVLTMATRSAADLLGLNDMGTLEIGKRSLCTAISLAEPLSEGDLYRSVLAEENKAHPLEIWLSGAWRGNV